MMQESGTERGLDIGLRQTDPAYPELSASPRLSLLIAITAVATVLGALPALVILDVLWLVSVFAALGIVVPAVYLRRFHTTRTVPPSLAEFAIAGVGTPFTPLLGSLLWLGTYYLVEFFADLLGGDGRDIAVIVTVPLAVGFGALYTLLAVENLATQLYPDIAGARSAHYAAAARRSNLIAGVLATAVVVALTLTLVDETANKAWVLLLYGFCLSALAWGPDAESPSGAETDQVSALRNLLTDHGLRLADVPRSDDVALDPYLSDIDLIATHGDIDYVVSLARGNEGPKGVRWTEAANLKLGAFAVTKMAADESQRFRHVLPLLVVTASLNDERLVAYCSAEQISLVQVSADGVRMHVARDADAWLHDVDWQSLQPPRRTKEASS